MGCCCSRPVDEDDEVKAVKADLSPKKGSYGTIAVENGKDVAETTLKESLPDVAVIRKKESPKTSPVKERIKHVRSNASDDVSPLLETPPTGLEGFSPKRSPRGTPSGSRKGTPSGSPRGTPQGTPQGTPKGSPHESPMPSPKRSPRRSDSPAKESLRMKLSSELTASKESLKKKLSWDSSSPSKESLQKKSSLNLPADGRPKSADYSKSVDTTNDSAPVSPSSPKPSLLDLAKQAVHGGNWEPGMSVDPVHSEKKEDKPKPESDIDVTSDEENVTSFGGSSFDQTPICHSGDEDIMSPKIITTFEYSTEAAAPAPVGATAATSEPSPKHSASPKHSLSPKHSATYGSNTSLNKREAKAKEAMKKTGKTMKDAGKKFTKMLKFGGGKDSPKTKKKEKKADQDKEEAKKGKVTFSSTTRAAHKESEGFDPII